MRVSLSCHFPLPGALLSLHSPPRPLPPRALSRTHPAPCPPSSTEGRRKNPQLWLLFLLSPFPPLPPHHPALAPCSHLTPLAPHVPPALPPLCSEVGDTRALRDTEEKWAEPWRRWWGAAPPQPALLWVLQLLPPPEQASLLLPSSASTSACL